MSERPKRYDGSQRPYDGSPKPKPPPAPPSSQSSPPTLPPVSPEDLVEGEWYVVRDSSGVGHVVCCVIDPDEGPGLYALDVCFEAGWNLKNVPIYGPLRFKIGGAS